MRLIVDTQNQDAGVKKFRHMTAGIHFDHTSLEVYSDAEGFPISP